MPASEQIRACETASACGLISDFAGCVRYASDIAGTVAHDSSGTFGPADITCMARAGSDCEAAARCTNLGAAPASCSVTHATCDGDVVRFCDGKVTRAWDCKALGLRCVVSNDGTAAECALGSCATDGDSCDVSGARTLSCFHGIEHAIDCTRDGASCRFDANLAVCVGDGHSCQATTQCDGDVIVTCATGNLQRIDCAARGLHCVVNYHPNADFECANATECDPAFDKSTCDGDGKIHYCYLGTRLVADCRAAGFAGCGMDSFGAVGCSTAR